MTSVKAHPMAVRTDGALVSPTGSRPGLRWPTRALVGLGALAAEATALTRIRTPLPALFGRHAAARAPFLALAPPGRCRLSLVCPTAPGVASHCQSWRRPPGVRLRGRPVPGSPVWPD